MRDLDLLDEPRTKPASSLEYKPEPATHIRVSVRGFRLFLALTLLNTTLLASSVLGPQLFPFLRTSWTQWQADRKQRAADALVKQALLAARQQCLTHAFAPGAAVYDEDPVESLRLIRDGSAGFARAMRPADFMPPGWVPPAGAVSPPYLMAWQQRVPGFTPGGCVLFLHERATPGGKSYLVCVQLSDRFEFDTLNDNDPQTRQYRTTFRQTKTRRISVAAWPVGPAADFDLRKTATGVMNREYRLLLPDTFQRPIARRLNTPEGLRAIPPTDYGNVLRIFGGQPDRGDPSKFSIAYQIDGHEGVLQGRLKDDAVELLPRDGDWTFDNGEILRLEVRPATQPTVYPPAPTAD
jgi:hypothetical protein